MRDLKQASVLSLDEVVISKKVQRDLKTLAAKLHSRASAVEKRWRESLPFSGDDDYGEAKIRALASINPGASSKQLAEGDLSAFLEQVKYHGKRLAKLDVPPSTVLSSLARYGEALAPDLKKFFPDDYPRYATALDYLNFCIKLTLNNAYYRVRDLEAQAFYEVFQDQLQSPTVQDLMTRVLDTLMRTFHADGGVILLRERGARKLVAKAWSGLDDGLASKFNTSVGRGLAGKIAKGGKPLFVVDASCDPLIQNAALRKAYHSIWGMPFIVGGEVIGVLQLAFVREYLCLPRERTLLGAISERCAMAIDKARLLEDLHDREEKIRQLGEHMLKVEEEERRRISRELHDEVGQSMLVIRLYLEMIRSDLPSEAAHLDAKLEDTQKLTEQTIREMRRLISALSPNVLEELGLQASIRQFVNNFRRTFAGEVHLELKGLDNLSKNTEIMLYRLLQECFSNVVKHSRAATVGLKIDRKNGRIHMKIQDNGVGFDVSGPSHRPDSFGLSGMRERVALLGGQIKIQSSLGKGTKVEIAIPALAPAPAAAQT